MLIIFRKMIVIGTKHKALSSVNYEESRMKERKYLMRPRIVLFMLVLVSLLITGCLPDEPDYPCVTPPANPDPAYPVDDDKYIYGEDAIIESLEVILLESFPVQAQVKVIGNLRNGCEELFEVEVEKVDMEFILTLTTRHPTGDIACTEALVPFEEVVRLEIEGLEAGTYSVIAQDQEATFELSVDNVNPGPASDKYEYGSDAVLESMSLNIMESFPIQVSVSLSGYLPNGCIKLEQINVLHDEDAFYIKIITKNPSSDVSCTTAIVPFEETVTLDVRGLPAGEYTVQCNEFSEVFTFDQDNKAP